MGKNARCRCVVINIPVILLILKNGQTSLFSAIQMTLAELVGKILKIISSLVNDGEYRCACSVSGGTDGDYILVAV